MHMDYSVEKLLINVTLHLLHKGQKNQKSPLGLLNV